MFDRRFLWTGVALAAVTALSFVISHPDRSPEITPIAENVAGIEQKAEPPRSSSAPESEPAGYAYLIKEYEGRVAVFSADGAEPEIILDVLVKYLPDYDRSQMQAGIPVENYSRLVSLIEDYIS